MIIEISVAVIAFAFVVLVIYIILTLKDLRKKSIALDPLFRSVENIGEVCEIKTNALKNEIKTLSELRNETIHARAEHAKAAAKKIHSRLEEEEEVVDVIDNGSTKVVEDIIDLTAIGIRLWQNFKKRR